MFSSLKIRSQLSTGALSPSAALTLAGLKPISTVPYIYGTANLLPGSLASISFISAGSRCCQFGSLLRSSGWNTPASICLARNTLDGTTTS
ncbi:hypothetical protein D3C75_1050300 [compost metagenome]